MLGNGLLGVFFFLPWVGNVLIGLLSISFTVIIQCASKRGFPELSCEGTELSFATSLPRNMVENRVFCAEY